MYKEILESKGFLQQNGIVQPEEAALFINTVSAFQPCVPYSLPLHQQLPDAAQERGCAFEHILDICRRPEPLRASCSTSRLPFHWPLQDCSFIRQVRLLACTNTGICYADIVLLCSAVMSRWPRRLAAISYSWV